MILIIGHPEEAPLARVIAALAARNAPFLVSDQKTWSHAPMHLLARDGRLHGRFGVAGQTISIEDIRAIYARPHDVTNRSDWAQDVQAGVSLLLDLSSALVVNRPRAMSSNASKPFQLQIIARTGFCVPDTIVTNDPEAVRTFANQHERVIYKSISGVRSIVRSFSSSDRVSLDRVRACPTQFQAFIEGRNVRVHVVGDRVFATEAHTDAVDYRYASRDGVDCTLRPVELENELERRCVSLVQGLGLTFGGIDLKLSPEGIAFCFEVNPSPGFSFYEEATGQPIAAAVANLLIAAN